MSSGKSYFYHVKDVISKFKELEDLDGFISYQKILMFVRKTPVLRTDAAKSVVEAYEGKLVNWKELLLEVLVEPFMAHPDLDDLSEQFRIFLKIIEKRKSEYDEYDDEVSEAELTRQFEAGYIVLKKLEFLEEPMNPKFMPMMQRKPRILYELYSNRRHNYLNSASELIELFYDILCKKETEGLGMNRKSYEINIVEVMMFFCLDFDPLLSLFRVFSVFSRSRNPSEMVLSSSFISMFLQVFTHEKDESLERNIEESFEGEISYEKFVKSEIGKKLIKKYGGSITRKVKRNTLMSFVQHDPRRRAYQLRSRNPFKPYKDTCGIISSYYLYEISKILEDEPLLPIDELQRRVDPSDLQIPNSRLRGEIMQNMIRICKKTRHSRMFRMILQIIENNANYYRPLKKLNNILEHAKFNLEAFRLSLEDGIIHENKKISKWNGVYDTKYKKSCVDIVKKYEALLIEYSDDNENEEPEKEVTEEKNDDDDDDERKKKETRKESFTLDELADLRLKNHYKLVLIHQQVKLFADKIVDKLFMIDPKTYGEDLIELTHSKESSIRIDDRILPHLFFFITREQISVTNQKVAMKFPHREFFWDEDEKSKDTSWKYSVEGKNMTIPNLLNVLKRAVWEVKIGLRNYIGFNWEMNSCAHWMTIFVRRIRDGNLELFVTDNFGGKRKMINLIRNPKRRNVNKRRKKKVKDEEEEGEEDESESDSEDEEEEGHGQYLFTTDLYEYVVREVEFSFEVFKYPDEEEKFWKGVEEKEKIMKMEISKGRSIVQKLLKRIKQIKENGSKKKTEEDIEDEKDDDDGAKLCSSLEEKKQIHYLLELVEIYREIGEVKTPEEIKEEEHNIRTMMAIFKIEMMLQHE